MVTACSCLRADSALAGSCSPATPERLLHAKRLRWVPCRRRARAQVSAAASPITFTSKSGRRIELDKVRAAPAALLLAMPRAGGERGSKRACRRTSYRSAPHLRRTCASAAPGRRASTRAWRGGRGASMRSPCWAATRTCRARQVGVPPGSSSLPLRARPARAPGQAAERDRGSAGARHVCGRRPAAQGPGVPDVAGRQPGVWRRDLDGRLPGEARQCRRSRGALPGHARRGQRRGQERCAGLSQH